MRTVFLDTVGLIALWNRSDQWHSAASAAFQATISSVNRLITTPFVLLECANDAARKPYRADVVRLREQFVLAGDLIEPTVAEIEHAWLQYEQGLIGSAGVVDLTSFAVMKRMGVSDAFTNDRHFSVAGFVPLF